MVYVARLGIALSWRFPSVRGPGSFLLLLLLLIPHLRTRCTSHPNMLYSRQDFRPIKALEKLAGRESRFLHDLDLHALALAKKEH